MKPSVTLKNLVEKCWVHKNVAYKIKGSSKILNAQRNSQKDSSRRNVLQKNLFKKILIPKIILSPYFLVAIEISCPKNF